MTFCFLATSFARDLAPTVVVVRIYAGAPYGEVICNVTTHLLLVGRVRQRVVVTGRDAGRFRLTDGGEVLAVGEYPALSGQIGDEYIANITPLNAADSETTNVEVNTVQLRVLVSRENMSPPRFVRDSPMLMEGDDDSYHADAYRYAVAGTLLRMRHTISVSDDDIVDYNRAVTFFIRHRSSRQWHRRRAANHDEKYLSIDPVTGELSSGRVLSTSLGGVMSVSIVAANSIASPPLSSSVDLTVYVCDVSGETSISCLW